MQKFRLKRPTLFLMLGSPGAGKSFFARQIADLLNIGHISGDRIRYELFENPRYDESENEIVLRIMDYMTEVALNAGMSVIYDDIGIADYTERLKRRQMAEKSKIVPLTLWVQTDPATAFQRANTRDRRRSDEKYSRSIDKETFDRLQSKLKQPQFRETFAVISGKFAFKTQAIAFIKKLNEFKMLEETPPEETRAQLPPHRPISTPKRDINTRHIRIR